MKRAEWLQETRKMGFEEAYGGWQGGRLTQEEAARLLGVCERTFRRYIDRYEDEGLDGLIDKRLSQVSRQRVPVDEVLRLVDRYRSRHEGWNVKHFYAWYKRDGGGRTVTPGLKTGCRRRSWCPRRPNAGPTASAGNAASCRV
jgi:Winged helix-turn helix